MSIDIILRSKYKKDTGMSLIEITMMMGIMIAVCFAVLTLFADPPEHAVPQANGDGSGRIQGMVPKSPVQVRPSPISTDITNDDVF